MSRFSIATLVALAASAAAIPAFAHVVAGDRVFPVTTTFDDPGVGDELTLPQITEQPGAGGQLKTQYQWEYDKRITDNTALIYNHGYDILRMTGSKTRNGLENATLTGKWQAITLPEHEFVASFGVTREFSGSAATVATGGDTYGSTAPTAYFGKGFGDLPIGFARPFAITGEFSEVLPDRQLNRAANNNGSPLAFKGALSLQYSLPYLQSQVKDVGLGNFFGRLVPDLELTYSTPTGGPSNPSSVTFQVAPTILYEADAYQIGLSALVPGNKAAGKNVGFLMQVHVFLDDVLPNSLGKPLLNW